MCDNIFCVYSSICLAVQKVYLSSDKEKASEDDYFQVCVHVDERIISQNNVTVFLQTFDGNALGMLINTYYIS